MDNIEVNVDFLINNPELKAASEQAKATISGVGVSAEQVAARVQANTEKTLQKELVSIDILNKKLDEAKKLARSATNETTIELANAKIQEYEKQIQRLSVIGKQGFDDLGNKIVDAVEKPIGRLQKLQALAKLYANGAATTNNPELLEKYNRKLQETQKEIERTKNVGKEGFDSLGDAITEGGTSLATKFLPGLSQLANLLPGIGIGGLVAFAVEPILKYISELDFLKPKLEEAELANKQLQSALAGGGEYSKAIENVQSLKINVALAKDGLYDKKAVIDQYNQSIGTVAGQVNTLEQAERGLIENADAFIEMTLRKSVAQLALEEASKKALEAMQKRSNRELEPVDIAKAGFKRLIGSSVADLGIGLKNEREDAAKRLDEESAALKTIATKAQKEAADLAKTLGGTLGLDKSNVVKANNVAQQAETLQRRVFEIQEEYARKAKTKDEEELQALRDRFTKIFEEVEKFNKNPKNKIKVDGSGLLATRDNAVADLTYRQETEKMKIGFEEQKKLYGDYEEYKKTFGEERAKARYENELNLSKTFAENVQDEYDKLANKTTLTGSETERMTALKKLLTEAKFSQLKIDDSAFKDALNASQSYFDKLVEIEKTYNKNRASLLKNGALTADRQEALDEAKNKAIESAKDEALQKTAIYRKLSVELLDYTKKQVIEQIATVKKALDSEVDLPAEIRSQLERDLSALEIKLKVGVEQSNLDALKLRFRELTQELGSKDDVGNSIVSEKERKRIVAALAEIQGKIKAIDANGNGKVSWGDKVAKQFEYLKGDTKEIAKGLEQDLGRLASGFDGIAQSVGGINSGLGRSLIALGSMTKMAGQLTNISASFGAGDIVGGVTGVMGILGGIIGGIQAADAAYESFYRNAIDGEHKYQDVLNERAILNAKIDNTAYKSAMEQVKIRKQEIEDYAKESVEIMKKLQGLQYVKEIVKNTFFGLFTMSTVNVLDTLAGKSFADLQKLLLEGKLQGEAKDLVTRLVELEKKGYDAKQALRDLAQQIAELFTGTTADSLTNSLVQMFQEGKTSAKDFADFFEKTMQDAALSIFKNKVLAEAMDKFYKEFAAEVSDGNLTSDEIKDLKALFEGLISGANTQFEALKQITGLDKLGSASSTASSGGSSISGVIQRSITEQTGSELLGLFRAMYDINKRTLSTSDTSLSVMREGLLAQQAIVANTGNTVKQLEIAVVELKGIARRTFQTAVGYDRGF